MASSNKNQPMGFRPLRYLGGNPWNGQSELYAFSASDAVDAYIYDICAVDTTNRSNGIVDVYRSGMPVVKTVASDITTAAQRGVIVGFLPQPEFSQSVTASLGLKYRQASTARYGWVVDDPFVIYEIQEDTQSYTSASSNAINKTVGTKYTAGSQITGVSGTQIKVADVQTAAARPVRLYRYSGEVDNFNWVAADNPSYAKWEVLQGNSDLMQATATNFGA